MRSVLLLLFGCFLLSLTGCSGGTSSVSGTVTFDGEPLKEGYIAFTPEGSGQGGGSQITNGAYSVSVKPGKYKVEITASKKVPLPPGQVGMYGEKEELRQYIPTKYNTESTLKADVPASGAVNFDLKSK